MIKYLKKIFSKFVLKKLSYLNQKIRVLSLRGNNYQCPICKYKAKKFVDYGKDNAAIRKYRIIGMGFRKMLYVQIAIVKIEKEWSIYF